MAMKCLIKKNILSLLNDDFKTSKQPDITPTFYPKRTPKDSIIDWSDDIFRIERFIRAVSPPFRGAFTFFEDIKLIIYDSQVFDFLEYELGNERPGKIVEVFTDKKFLVKCYGGLLLINSFESVYIPKKDDVFNNNGHIINYFRTNKFGNYDIEET
jgi:methionyl-tRNA formyltransferase